MIDGRSWVPCFLNSPLEAEPGPLLLFDDYTHRPHHHLMEEFCPIEQTEGHQVLFPMPVALNRGAMRRE